VVEVCPGSRGSRWRLALAALAAVALLVTGLAGALPGADGRAPGTTAQAAAVAAGSGATSMEAPGSDVVVHGAALAVVPAPTGPAAGLLPVDGPVVAAHLVAQPQSRPPTSRLAAAAVALPSSRAPPATTGT